MRVRVIRLVQFDAMEFNTLKRVEPSVRIAFPQDDIASARKQEGVRGPKTKKAQQEWEGRWLAGICSRREEWDANAIWAAWDAAVTLEAVLEAQADRDYWVRELKPDYERRVEQGAAVVGLIAPGTDACGILAEARQVQLRELREAMPIIEDARTAVGLRPEPYEHIRHEGA
jgi:hypothetical protein